MPGQGPRTGLWLWMLPCSMPLGGWWLLKPWKDHGRSYDTRGTEGWFRRLTHIQGAMGPSGTPWVWLSPGPPLPAPPIYGDTFHVASGSAFVFSFPAYLQEAGSWQIPPKPEAQLHIC